MTSRTRVCVIGAGVGGLLSLQNLLRLDGSDQDIVCFEKQSTLGGQWNFDWRTGTDEFGETCHSSMYKGMWANNCKEFNELPQYTYDEHFGRPVQSFLPREAVQGYIEGFSRRFNLERFIRYNTVVRMVKYNEDDNSFNVTVTELRADKTYDEIFTHVIVAIGIFSTPKKADIQGIATYPGFLINAHDVKDFTPFKDKSVLVIGSGFSAVDIATMSLKYGAREICVSHKLPPDLLGWPVTMTQRPLVKNIDSETVYFEDGTAMKPEIIVLCTGYLCHFPFMDNDLRLRTKLSLYPENLYKGLLFAKGGNGKLFYVGVMNHIFTFAFLDIQSAWVASYIRGKLKDEPVSRSQMTQDMDVWGKRANELNYFPAIGQFQIEYCAHLATVVGVDTQQYYDLYEHFKTLVECVMKDITTFRDVVYKSVYTGTVGLKLPKPWMEVKDGDLNGEGLFDE